MSLRIGIPKPKPEIFRHALKVVNAKKSESIMIGDDLNLDIIGAKKAGMGQIYYNPQKITHNEEVTFEIYELLQMKELMFI